MHSVLQYWQLTGQKCANFTLAKFYSVGTQHKHDVYTVLLHSSTVLYVSTVSYIYLHVGAVSDVTNVLID